MHIFEPKEKEKIEELLDKQGVDFEEICKDFTPEEKEAFLLNLTLVSLRIKRIIDVGISATGVSPEDVTVEHEKTKDGTLHIAVIVPQGEDVPPIIFGAVTAKYVDGKMEIKTMYHDRDPYRAKRKKVNKTA